MGRILALIGENDVTPEDYLRAVVALVREGALSGVRVAGRFFSRYASWALADLPPQVRVERGEEVVAASGLAGFLALTDPVVVYGRWLGGIRPLYRGPAPEDTLRLVARAVTLVRLVDRASFRHTPSRIGLLAGTATVGAIDVVVIAPWRAWLSAADGHLLQPMREAALSVGAILREELLSLPLGAAEDVPEEHDETGCGD